MIGRGEGEALLDETAKGGGPMGAIEPFGGREGDAPFAGADDADEGGGPIGAFRPMTGEMCATGCCWACGCGMNDGDG